jgi:hypothetical protein
MAPRLALQHMHHSISTCRAQCDMRFGEARKSVNANSCGAAVQETAAPPPPAAEEGQLRIAWQYRRYIRRQQAEREAGAGSEADFGRPPDGAPAPARAGAALAPAAGGRAGGGAAAGGAGGRERAGDAGAARRWCHEYDLTRPLGEAALRGVGAVRRRGVAGPRV